MSTQPTDNGYNGRPLNTTGEYLLSPGHIETICQRDELRHILRGLVDTIEYHRLEGLFNDYDRAKELLARE